ncbi:hypothetical protein ACHAXT_001482 [Thalassiosira profunda]
MAVKSRCRSYYSTTSLLSQPASADAEEKELTPEAIAEMIEVSFLQSCLQLSQGYIDVLKLFIVAVKAGYERGMPLSELHKLVEECPVNSAGRDLMTEEKELRLEWMGMVYAMLNALGPESKVDSREGTRSESANERISKVVEAMLAIREGLQSEEETTGGKEDATVALTTLTVETALERSPSLSKLSESISDPMEKAFLTNDIRVALMTFRVLQEEQVCLQDGSGKGSRGKVPRPPIPGTGR